VRTRPIHDRLWEKIDAKGPDDCWPWRGGRGADGYGAIRHLGTSKLAHRVVFELTHKKNLAPALCVCHHCDNRLCCNPGHLFLGTVGDNNADRHAKGRSRGGRNNGSSNPRSKITEEVAAAIYGSSGYDKDIAKRFGVNAQLVSSIKTGNSWRSVTRHTGDKRPPPLAILTPKQALEIYHAEERGCDLAKRFGVSPVTVSNIKTGKRWAHVTGARRP
jgi:hypothetical protein